MPKLNYRNRPIRVLYSYPHKLGADRICNTAWQLVNSLSAAGADILLFPGVLHKSFPLSFEIRPTLARGKFRIPYKVLGKMRALALHDWIVSRRLEKLAGQIDIVHTWPSAGLQTIRTAANLGIPSVIERPNAHTRYAYEVVRKECERIGVPMPVGHEHAFNMEVLKREEAEFRLADYLMCPSDFVAKTFIEYGFARDKLVRHQYGFDDKLYYPDNIPSDPTRGLSVLFVGGCAPRKGLHFALEAWLRSSAHQNGKFLIAGEFIPSYAEKLCAMLGHVSVHVLGHRADIPDLMRKSDILILPSIEEGSALVTSEARGSGCVLLVSEAAGAICKHMENALVHSVGDVSLLSEHITMLNEDRKFLETLRVKSLKTVHEITWAAAGEKLLQAYRKILNQST